MAECAVEGCDREQAHEKSEDANNDGQCVIHARNQVIVPWDQATVDSLNEYQVKGYFHPYTCPNRGDGKHTYREERGGDLGALLATPSGWICGECDYTQNWAHVSSLSARNTLAELVESWSKT